MQGVGGWKTREIAEGGKPGSSRSLLPGQAGGSGLLWFLGSQVWGPPEGRSGGGGTVIFLRCTCTRRGRRVTTSDYLLNPLECPLFALFFVPLAFNRLLYGHMCGN